jgi:hypothetical protein
MLLAVSSLPAESFLFFSISLLILSVSEDSPSQTCIPKTPHARWLQAVFPKLAKKQQEAEILGP